MYVRRTRPRAIPLAMTIKNYQHAFKYDYGAPLPRPTAAEEFRYKPSRTLRSANQKLLVIPRSNTTTYGDRAFSICAPKLWNYLPATIRGAKSLSSGTPLRPKAAKVEPHTHTKRYAGDFLWSWQAEWLAGACAVHTYIHTYVRTYIAFHDILT